MITELLPPWVVEAVDAELARQIELKKQGRFTHTTEDGPTDGDRLAHLVEEVGEVGRCLNEKSSREHLRKELVQTMAVCAGWLRHLSK